MRRRMMAWRWKGNGTLMYQRYMPAVWLVPSPPSPQFDSSVEAVAGLLSAPSRRVCGCRSRYQLLQKLADRTVTFLAWEGMVSKRFRRDLASTYVIGTQFQMAPGVFGSSWQCHASEWQRIEEHRSKCGHTL
jgi:hypothetical protein